MLHVRRFGTGRELVSLHGFSLTGEQFSPFGESLNHLVVAPDLPGHGLSRTAPCDVASVLAGVESLLELPGGPRALLGYSQGGRVALLTALRVPATITALVLISANAGIRDSGDRQMRSDQDADLANRIMADGLEAFLNSWTTAGITSVDHLSAEYHSWDRDVRSENTAEGLASALQGYGQGVQPCVWEELADLSMPVLLIAGEQDERYRAINEQMQALIAGAELSVVSGAGHNPLADQPDATLRVVSDFLNRNG